jgi:branched-chain amino acid transport system permease protein
VEYAQHLMVLCLLYATASIALNVSSGMTRIVSLAHAAFFGIGAYVSALLVGRFQWPIGFAILTAAVLATTAALPLAVLAIRTTRDYFVLASLSFNLIIFSLLNNLSSLTGGPSGMTGIPTFSAFGYALGTRFEWILVCSVLLAIELLISLRLRYAGFGRVLFALAEDELFCQSLGKNVGLAKVQAFLTGAFLIAIPGACYAHYVTFIDPTSFSVDESVFMLSIIVVGGLGNIAGGILAACFLILLPEALRFVGLPPDIGANLRRIIYGLVLVAVVIRRHQLTAQARTSKPHTLNPILSRN